MVVQQTGNRLGVATDLGVAMVLEGYESCFHSPIVFYELIRAPEQAMVHKGQCLEPEAEVEYKISSETERRRTWTISSVKVPLENLSLSRPSRIIKI